MNDAKTFILSEAEVYVIKIDSPSLTFRIELALKKSEVTECLDPRLKESRIFNTGILHRYSIKDSPDIFGISEPPVNILAE